MESPPSPWSQNGTGWEGVAEKEELCEVWRRPLPPCPHPCPKRGDSDGCCRERAPPVRAEPRAHHPQAAAVSEQPGKPVRLERE